MLQILVDLTLCFNPLCRLKDLLYIYAKIYHLSLFYFDYIPTLHVEDMPSYQGQGNPVAVGVGVWTSLLGHIHILISPLTVLTTPDRFP